MAFVAQNLSMLSQINNDSPWSYTYNSGTDAIATVTGANYFSAAAFNLRVGDIIYVVASDVNSFITVTAVNTGVFPATITTSQFDVSGSVGTANITNLAVTAAKIANNTITATQIANNTIDSGQLALDVLQRVTVDINNAGVLGMAATPVSVIAAPGANLVVIVDKCIIRHNFATSGFTGTPNIGLQYGNTADLAGIAASGVISATGLFSGSANEIGAVGGALAGNLVSAVANTAVYISSVSALTVGGGSATVDVYYKVIATTGD